MNELIATDTSFLTVLTSFGSGLIVLIVMSCVRSLRARKRRRY